jgi:hypothetical protein
MPEKTYLVSPWRLWGPPGAFACLAAAMLVASSFAQSDAERRAAQLTALVVAAIGGGTLPLGLYPRLVVSDRGLTLRHVGWQVSTTWDAVERLELQPGNEGLYLRQALTGRGAWALRTGRYLPGWYTEEQDRRAGEGRWFPLQPFAWWLRHGDLQQRIERHAPWLLRPASS